MCGSHAFDHYPSGAIDTQLFAIYVIDNAIMARMQLLIINHILVTPMGLLYSSKTDTLRGPKKKSLLQPDLLQVA